MFQRRLEQKQLSYQQLLLNGSKWNLKSERRYRKPKQMISCRSMGLFGRRHQNFNLEFGDFFDMKYRDLILQEATIIFLNNYAFQSDLETRIKQEFIAELRNGTRIISNKPYVPLNKIRITDRQLSGKFDIIKLKPFNSHLTLLHFPIIFNAFNKSLSF